MKRRAFLRLFGMGAATAGAAAAGFAPLIGSASEILSGKEAEFFYGHLVFTRTPPHPKVRFVIPSVNVEGMKIQLYRDSLDFSSDKRFSGGLSGPSISLSPPTREPNQVFRRVLLKDGEDPHYAVYEAAMSLREGITKKANRILSLLGKRTQYYKDLKLVTIAWSPIQVLPGTLKADAFYDPLTPFEGDPPQVTSSEGLHLLAEFQQFAVDGGAQPGTKQFLVNGSKTKFPTVELYSETGKFPLNPPTDVELAILLDMDKNIRDSYEVADRIRKLRLIRLRSLSR